MKIRPVFLAIAAMIALSSCAQTHFSALEQQQISIEDPALFESVALRGQLAICCSIFCLSA